MTEMIQSIKREHQFASKAVNKLYFMVFCLFISNIVLAQNKGIENLSIEIGKNLQPDVSKLKDSIAFYSFAFQIEIKKVNKHTIVEKITVNDSIAHIIFPDYSFLKKLDYGPLFRRSKYVTLIVPVGLIIANYESKKISEYKISLVDFSKRIHNLFNSEPRKKKDLTYFIYMSPSIITVDKAIYD